MGVFRKGNARTKARAGSPSSRSSSPFIKERRSSGRGQEFTAKFDSQAICGYCGEWGIAVKYPQLEYDVRALKTGPGVLHKDGSTAASQPWGLSCGTVPAALRQADGLTARVSSHKKKP